MLVPREIITQDHGAELRSRTREIKRVDFGFSFGGPALGLSEPSPLIGAPELSEPPQTQPAPIATTPPSSQIASQSESQAKSEEPLRTPGSARNHLPQRPSTYDIPSDDRLEQQGSNKRRKISASCRCSIVRFSINEYKDPPNSDSNTPTRRAANEPTKGKSPPTQNSATDGTGTPAFNNVATGASNPDESIHGATDDLRQSRPLPVLGTATIENTQEDQIPREVGDGAQTASPTVVESRRMNKEQGPGSNTSLEDSTDNVRPSRRQSPKAVLKEAQPVTKTTEHPPKKSRKSRSPPQLERTVDGTKGQTSGGLSRSYRSPAQPTGDKTRAGVQERDGVSADASKTISQHQGAMPPTLGGKRHVNDWSVASPELALGVVDQEPQDLPESERESRRRLGKVANGNHSPSQTADERDNEAESQLSNESESIGPRVSAKTTRRRQEKSSASTKATEANTSRDRPGNSINKRNVGESSKSGPRKRPRRKPTQPSAVQSEPEPEPELEPGQPQEAEQGIEPGASQSQRTRPGKKKHKRATEREPASPEERQAESTHKARRKPREPRGETIPITVHRLTNVSALGAIYASPSSGGEEEDSADELTTRQKTKLPNRGGVNAADVLGQICRETLEKTLTTLKNGISNETNPARRAEWTRKRKAVEMYATELDGRLLDLSEMLDSNFVLGLQFKKAKREMMELRSRLYQARRERESIALQMDAVRSKHMEEESNRTVSPLLDLPNTFAF